MDSYKYSKNNEDFVSNLDFPQCQTHKKLHNEFVCLETDCNFSHRPLCSFCFKQNHEANNQILHAKYEIRTILCYLLENQTTLFNREEILKSIPFYYDIPEKLNIIETKILELQKMKTLLIEMKSQIDERLESCQYFKGNLRGLIQKENEKNCLMNLLEKFLKIIGKNGPHSLKINEFSEQERTHFEDKLENLNKLIDFREFQLQFNNAFLFDNGNKTDDIVVLSNNKVIKRICEKKPDERFAFVSPKLTKSAKILLKINNLSNWIGVGLAKFELIRKNQFKFLYNDMPLYKRGYYLISSNGYCWSDIDENFNKKELSFKFMTGSIISIVYDQEGKFISFEDIQKGKKTVLNIQNSFEDNFVFAVNLCGTNDEVQIL